MIDNNNDDILEPNKKENKIYSTTHSLFLKDIPSNAIPQDGNDKYFRIVTPFTEYNLYLGNFLGKDQELHNMFYILRQSSIEDYLDIRIHSHGGSVDEGKQLYNIVTEYFGGRTRTILDSVGYSMGALVFCMGQERIIYENSTLMFHDYSHIVGGKGGEIETQVTHHSHSIRDFVYSIIVPPGFLSEEEFETMLIGQDYWMDSYEICYRGVATHIIIHGNKVKAEHYIKFIDGDISYDEMTTGNIMPKKKKSKKKKSKKKIENK